MTKFNMIQSVSYDTSIESCFQAGDNCIWAGMVKLGEERVEFQQLTSKFWHAMVGFAGITADEFGLVMLEFGQTEVDLGQAQVELGQTKVDLEQVIIEFGQAMAECSLFTVDLVQVIVEFNQVC